MRETELHLTDEDRKLIESYRLKGSHHAREVNRAHILSALDRGVPEARIMEVLGVGRTVSGERGQRIWRVGWNTRCVMQCGLANRPNTVRMSKHRFRSWPAHRRRKGPRAGHWNCWSKRRTHCLMLGRSAARRFAGC